MSGLLELYKGVDAGGLGEDCVVLDDGFWRTSGSDEAGDNDAGSSNIVLQMITSKFRAVVFLFEIMLGSDNSLSCLRGSTYPTVAATLMNGCKRRSSATHL